MVASGVLERNAGKKAAPKKMARSRSTRRDARTATRRVASEPAPRPRSGERWRTLAPSTNGGEPNVAPGGSASGVLARVRGVCACTQ